MSLSGPKAAGNSASGLLQIFLETVAPNETNMSRELWYLPVVTSLLSGLVGASLVYYFGIRQLAIQRKSAFRERQLAEFYAPLAGIRKQILAKSELRLKISDEA